ncbi:hypothetical protein WA158_000753 [Blastocystis sp. Blastoise]
MAKKGLSADEKRTKIVSALAATKGIYNMKELEKIGKEQGISPMIIKDVIQGCLDDDLLMSEKVGTQTLYWTFPSTTYVTKKRRLEETETNIASLSKEVESLEQQVSQEKASKQETEERIQMLQDYAELSEKHKQLTAEVGSLRERDPETVSLMKKQIKDSVDDNVWTLKSYIVRKYGYNSKDVDNMLEIPSDFDYIEYKP